MIVQKSFKEFSFTAFIAVLIFVFVAFQENSYAQSGKTNQTRQNESQDDVIRVDTDLVMIPTTVLDREGRYIANLKKEDFQIFENNVEQEVSFFESVRRPITVLLLLDVSDSMTSHKAELENASNVFVNQLYPDDQLIAVTFDEQVDLLFGAKSVKDVRESKKFRLRIDKSYGTMIYDAVEYSLKKMKKVRGRKVIVLFSDGIGKGTFASAEDNLREVEENETLIYTIRFNTYSIAPSYTKTAIKYMQDLARTTGGRSYQIEDIADLEKTFGLVVDELSQQYSLGYYPKQLEAGQKRQTRQIKIKMRQPNLVVRARSSYVVEPQKKTKH